MTNKHRMYCAKSNMSCAVYHPDGICPDVRDCEGCKAERDSQPLETDSEEKYQRVIGALADIAFSEDMTWEIARKKAKRIYNLLEPDSKTPLQKIAEKKIEKAPSIVNMLSTDSEKKCEHKWSENIVVCINCGVPAGKFEPQPSSDWEGRFDKKFVRTLPGGTRIVAFGGTEDDKFTVDYWQDYVVKSFISNLLASERKKTVGMLKRLKLEVDTVVCDCGEPYKESDLADLINEFLAHIKDKKE